MKRYSLDDINIPNILTWYFMIRRSKPRKYYALQLIFICITLSILSVKGWCVNTSNDRIETHIRLITCHSEKRVCNDSPPSIASQMSHSADNKHCTSCFEISPESIVALKLFDDSFDAFISTSHSNSFTVPQLYSELKSFSTASLDGVLATNESSSRQNLQILTLRSIVLLI